MVACGTLKGQYSLDNSRKPLTQRIQTQGRMAELEVKPRLASEDAEQEELPVSCLWHCVVQWTEGVVSLNESAPSRDQPDLLCSTV